jgi:hypothetical protein
VGGSGGIKESNEEWYLNSKRIEQTTYQRHCGRKSVEGQTVSCFFDAKSDLPYAEAIHAIDLIEQSPGRVVLLTPETKKVHIP